MVLRLTIALITLSVIAFLIFSLTKKSKAKTKLQRDYNRNLAKITKIIVLLLLPPTIVFTMLSLFIATLPFWQRLHKKPPGNLTAANICVWENELYSGKADPADIGRIIRDETAVASEDSAKKPKPETDNEPAPGTDEGEKVLETGQTEIIPTNTYDYSILECFGSYQFGETITPDDLAAMEIMYQEYWSGKSYWNILETVDDKPDKAQEVLKDIEQFDSDMRYNRGSLTAEAYYTDAKNKLFMYKCGEENYSYLELAAIGAESAAELEDVVTSGGYQTLLEYIHTAVAGFSGVLEHEYQPYFSGSETDVKYRIGKLLCKPAMNLQELTLSEKFYSLCCSYAILKDAFSLSTPEDKYYMELAYNYLLVLSNIFKYMEPEQRGEVYEEAMAAYCRFRDKGESESSNPFFMAHQKEAEEIVYNLNSQLIKDGLYKAL